MRSQVQVLLGGGLDLPEDARARLTFGRVDPDDLDELDVLAFASGLLECGSDVGQLAVDRKSVVWERV